MDKKYLPSKKFTSRLIILTLTLLAGFLISEVSPEIKERIENNKRNKKLSVKELVYKDSNENSIADWEESLFGLDPKGDGEENKKIIEEKRKELNINTENIESNDLSKNDILSRELFSIISTLDQTGNLNKDSIENLSKALNEKLNSDPILDIYTKNDLSTTKQESENISNYYNQFGEIAIKYENTEIGNELAYISQGLLNQDQKAIDIAREIAKEYQNFSKELIAIKNIPTSISGTHLKLANDYYKTGISIERMAVMLEDPLFGMNAVADYKNFSDSIIKNLEDIGDFFEKML